MNNVSQNSIEKSGEDSSLRSINDEFHHRNEKACLADMKSIQSKSVTNDLRYIQEEETVKNFQGKQWLIDASTVIEIFLNRIKYSNALSHLVKVLEREDVYVFISEYSVAKIRFYLEEVKPRLAETALTWLSEELNAVVLIVKSESLVELQSQSYKSFDVAVELAAAHEKGLSTIVTLRPELYAGTGISVISVMDSFRNDANERVDNLKGAPILGEKTSKSVRDKKRNDSLCSSLREQLSDGLSKGSLRILVDADLLLAFVSLKSADNSSINECLSMLQDQRFEVFVTDYGVSKIEYYLELTRPDLAENALIWLEQHIQIQVLLTKGSIINRLTNLSDIDVDCSLEAILAKEVSTDIIVSLEPKSYENIEIPVISANNFVTLRNPDAKMRRKAEDRDGLDDAPNFSRDFLVQLRISTKEWQQLRSLIALWRKQFNLGKSHTSEYILTECLSRLDQKFKRGDAIPISSRWFYHDALNLVRELACKTQQSKSIKHQRKESIGSQVIAGIPLPDLTNLYEKVEEQTKRYPDIKVGLSGLLPRQLHASNSSVYSHSDAPELDFTQNVESGNSDCFQEETFLSSRFLGKDFRGLNFSGLDLSRVDFSNANLDGVHFHRANLTGANLAGASLRSAELNRAVLERANLDEANLHSADLGRANLDGASLERAIFIKANLTKASLQGANCRSTNLSNAILVETDFRGAYLKSAILEGSNLTKADFIQANLTNAKMKEVVLRGAKLNNATVKGADLRGADCRPDLKKAANVTQIISANLAGADLRGARLYRVNAKQTSFNGADLRGAKMMEAKLLNTNFEGTNLAGANLHRADLGGAILTEADMRSTILTEALIRGSSLKKADLTNAQLDRASLEGAYFRNANLSGARLIHVSAKRTNFSHANLTRACFNHSELSHANFEDADLSDAVLVDTTLQGALLNKAICIGADFSSALLQGASLKETNLEKALLKDTHFQGAYMKRAIFRGALLLGTKLSRCRLKRADFSGVKFEFVELKDADMRFADFSGSCLLNVSLKGANLSGANFTRARLEEVDFRSSNLTLALFPSGVFQDCDMDGVNLSDADMSGTSLIRTKLNAARMSAVSLKNATLFQTYLRRACLNDANLENANLTQVLLDRSDLSGATLRSAVLRETSVVSVRLLDVDFTDITLDKTDLSDSSLLCRTKDTHFLKALNPPHERDMHERFLDMDESLGRLSCALLTIEHVKDGFEAKARNEETMGQVVSIVSYLAQQGERYKSKLELLKERIFHIKNSASPDISTMQKIHEVIDEICRYRRHISLICRNPYDCDIDVEDTAFAYELIDALDRRSAAMNYVNQATFPP
jgi:uncharacterized protein YjbI with pentapeptide repeats